MRRLLIALLLSAHAAAAEPLPEAFPSGDLTGWRATRHADSWTLVDRVLNLQSDLEREGSVLWTERDYTDFVIEFEFRFGPGRIDSGVFLRHEQDQIQIGESNSLRRDMTGSPYIGGLGYPVEAQVEHLLRPDDWNAMKIVVIGSRYDVWLNGEHVMDYTSETATPRGPVGLQIHPGNEMQMQYRGIRLAELQQHNRETSQPEHPSEATP